MDEEAIRKAAHAKWEAEGRPDGQGDRHWREAQEEHASSVQTWSADHGGGVSPPSSTGSVEEEQVHEPSNDWPAAGPEQDLDPIEQVPAPVDHLQVPKGKKGRAFQNRDTDR